MESHKLVSCGYWCLDRYETWYNTHDIKKEWGVEAVLESTLNTLKAPCLAVNESWCCTQEVMSVHNFLYLSFKADSDDEMNYAFLKTSFKMCC